MEFVQVLKDFIPMDKSFIDILDRDYHRDLVALGRFISEKKKELRCKDLIFTL